MYVCTYVCTYVCMYVCVCMYVYIYIYRMPANHVVGTPTDCSHRFVSQPRTDPDLEARCPWLLPWQTGRPGSSSLFSERTRSYSGTLSFRVGVQTESWGKNTADTSGDSARLRKCVNDAACQILSLTETGWSP